MRKIILAIILTLLLNFATVFADTLDDDSVDFMPPNFEKIMQEKKEREAQLQREIIQKLLIGGAVLIVIFIGVAKLSNTRKFQFAKDYFYMQKLTPLAKNKSASVVNEIYAFCITREHLREVIAKHNATPNDFEKIYNDLITYCNAESGKMFIPVATFFFASSLEYVLSNRIKSRAAGEKVARNLKNYFDNLRH